MLSSGCLGVDLLCWSIDLELCQIIVATGTAAVTNTGCINAPYHISTSFVSFQGLNNFIIDLELYQVYIINMAT